jgi:flagellar basal-body rod protein FlgC
MRLAITNTKWHEQDSGLNGYGLSMISAYQSAISGLQAFGSRIASNGNNIANVASETFKGTRVLLEESSSGGVATQVDLLPAPATTWYDTTNNGYEMVALSNVDLAGEMVSMNLNEIYYKANLRTIQTTNEMFGSLLSLKA